MENQPSRDDAIVLLIGGVDHEGVVSSVVQSGRKYRKKELHSNPPNWQTIISFFDENLVSAAIIKLSSGAYQRLVDSDYEDVATPLVQKISSVPHIVFIHEGLFTGEKDEDDELAQFFGSLNADVRVTVNAFLSAHRLNVVTYRKNSEVTISAQAFLSHCEAGLLLRMYVPNGQLWANETDRMLQLFRDYLTRIASLDVRLNETRTGAGVIYELHGDVQRGCDLSGQFERFSSFMSLCATDSSQAMRVLESKNIGKDQIMQILTRYAKEVRRLQVDMRHEREQKVLQIRHRLESELLDVVPNDFSVDSLGELVDAAVPKVLGPQSSLSVSGYFPQAIPNLTLNINPQFVETLNGIVAQEVSGDISFNESDRELLKLFAEYADEQHAELVSALRELNDTSAPTSGRLTAKQKIKTFLFSIGSRAADLGVGVLQTYIERKLLDPQ